MSISGSRAAVWVSLVSSVLAGCVSPDGYDGDPIDDRFLSADGKSDDGIAEGSPEAQGVLKLANEATYQVLHGDVPLVQQAAQAIVDQRTQDSIDTLEELDVVPYVGRTAFQSMLQYAQQHGYVPAPRPTDPFDPGYCPTPMTRQQAIAKFPAGSTGPIKLVDLQMQARVQPCNDLTGCGEWISSNGDRAWTIEKRMSGGSVAYRTVSIWLPMQATGYLEITPQDPRPAFLMDTGKVWGDSNGNLPTGTLHGFCDSWGNGLCQALLIKPDDRRIGSSTVGIGPPTGNGQSRVMVWEDVIGPDCVRLVQRHKIGGHQWELVAYGRY